jgi:hypothetical protein
MGYESHFGRAIVSNGAVKVCVPCLLWFRATTAQMSTFGAKRPFVNKLLVKLGERALGRVTVRSRDVDAGLRVQIKLLYSDAQSLPRQSSRETS